MSIFFPPFGIDISLFSFTTTYRYFLGILSLFWLPTTISSFSTFDFELKIDLLNRSPSTLYSTILGSFSDLIGSSAIKDSGSTSYKLFS